MSVVKVRCRLVAPEVKQSHQIDFIWPPLTCDMESQMIRNDGACMHWHTVVHREKNTRRQQQTLLFLASLVPRKPLGPQASQERSPYLVCGRMDWKDTCTNCT
eukprot:5249027-Amphidinium_carterae.1